MSDLVHLVDSLFCDDEGFIDGSVSRSVFSIPDLYGSFVSLLPVDVDVERVLHRHGGSSGCFCGLHALKTPGDGDCLLHAVSLSIWGQEDKKQLLRGLLSLVLSSAKISAKFSVLWYVEEINRDIQLVMGPLVFIT